MAVLLNSTRRLTQEESELMDYPWERWPQSLKELAGPLGPLVEAEDARAQANAHSQGNSSPLP